MRSADEDEDVAVTIGKLAAGAFFVGLVLLFAYWSSLERWTAERRTDRAALWFYASDVAPGDLLHGRVKIYSSNVAISGMTIETAGGDEVESELLADSHGSDEISFTVTVPPDATPGSELQLHIETQYAIGIQTVASIGGGREPRKVRFRIDVPIHSAKASALRRAGKAVLAFVLWAAVVIIVVVITRWHFRRDRPVGLAWSGLLVPHAVLGWFGFSTFIEHATRLHGWWVVGICIFVWYLAFVVVHLVVRRDGHLSYAVVQARLPSAEGEAYRGSSSTVPSVEVHVLVEAWRAAGSVVETTRDELLVTHHRGRARVRIPSSGRFGAGETFAIRCDDEATALELITSAASVLGELRWNLVSRGLERVGPRGAQPAAGA